MEFVVLLCDIDKRMEKGVACQQRFTALKGKGDTCISRCRGIIIDLGDEMKCGIFCHDSVVGMLAAGSFLLIETVGTAQIACGGCRLEHDVQCGHGKFVLSLFHYHYFTLFVGKCQ